MNAFDNDFPDPQIAHPMEYLPELENVRAMADALGHQAHRLQLGAQDAVTENRRQIEAIRADQQRMLIDREQQHELIEATFHAAWSRSESVIAKLTAQIEFYTGAPRPVQDAPVVQHHQPVRVPRFVGVKRLLGMRVA
jgi:hypothetical protein